MLRRNMTKLTATDGRVPREVGQIIRGTERAAKIDREIATSDIERAARLRRAASLPKPALGPRIAR